MSGTVITYKKDINIVWLGCAFSYTPVPRCTFTLRAAAAPYEYAVSIDHHCETGAYYRDIMSGCFCAHKASFETDFALTGTVSLIFNLSCEGSTLIFGTDSDSASETGPYYKFSDAKSASSYLTGEAVVACRIHYSF